MNIENDDLIEKSTSAELMNSAEVTTAEHTQLNSLTHNSTKNCAIDDTQNNISTEEDVLGHQRLIVSDSESEDENLINSSKQFLKNSNKPLETETVFEIKENVKNDTIINNSNKLPPICDINLIDNRALTETTAHTSTLQQKSMKNNISTTAKFQKDEPCITSISECKNEDILTTALVINTPKVQSKISHLIDEDSSDSENMNSSSGPQNLKLNSKIKTMVKLQDYPNKKFDEQAVDYNADSLGDEPYIANTKSQNKKNTRKLRIVDSESENEYTQTTTSVISSLNTKSKISNLVDEDSSESLNSLSEFEDSELTSEIGKTILKQPKDMRASAKKALDNISAIQSEQQRLHREAHISVPYHKPKRHTLQEFLKRRTIMKPSFNTTIQSRKLKMSEEELEEYAKLMEERAKEAKEFFKSESESNSELKDTKSTFKDNDDIIYDTDKQTNIEKIPDLQKNIENANVSAYDVPIVDDNKYKIYDVNEPHKAFANDVQLFETVPNIQIDRDNFPDKPEILSHILITNSNTNNEVLSTLKADSIMSSPLTPLSNMKKKIMEQKLIKGPTIQGDSNMIIDLETGDMVTKERSGVDKLFQRFLLTCNTRKTPQPKTLNILSAENGKIEISNVKLSLKDETDDINNQKPGAAFLKLKENLKSIISKKRQKDMKMKQNDEVNYFKHFDETNNFLEYDPETKTKKLIEFDDEENTICLDNEENEDMMDSKSEEDDNDGEQSDHDSLSTNNEIQSETENKLMDNNDDHDEDDDENYDEDNNDDIDNDKKKGFLESNQNVEEIKEPVSENRRSRIIKMLNNDDTDDDFDFLKTQTQSQSENNPQIEISSMFNVDINKCLPHQQQDILSFSSDKFDASQADKVPSIISQIPMTQRDTQCIDPSELLVELCSGKFEDADGTIPLHPFRFTSSDEEKTQNLANSLEIRKRTKKLKKRKTKTTLKLEDSDEEIECISEQLKENVDEDKKEESEIEAENIDYVETETEEFEQTYVEYDSEENEIEVKMTKEECVKRAQTFVEQEAELSESEWDSVDEDENNLDRYDIELGDEDDFDREKLRVEVGRIHARKVLDDDIKEIRKIQELFFEDEEKDGVGRQRQFKWKNIESAFSLDVTNPNEPTEGGDSADEENEQIWRRVRYEREQALKEKRMQEKTNTSLLIDNNGGGIGTSVKKLNVISAKLTKSGTSQPNSPFLILKSVNVQSEKNTVRGSFLKCDKDTLNRLAGMTKPSLGGSSAVGVGSIEGAAGSVSLKDLKRKNFVFTTLTEEERDQIKRRADDLMNCSNEHGVNYVKKRCVESKRPKCLIDELL